MKKTLEAVGTSRYRLQLLKQHEFTGKASAVTPEEIAKLNKYLRRLFKNDSIEVRRRPRKDDSAEVYIGDEFIGVLFKDDEDPNDLSYNFQMAILDYDLED